MLDRTGGTSWSISSSGTAPPADFSSGSDEYGPRLNTGVGTMVVGSTFYVGYEPVGEAAIGTTFRIS